MQTVLREGHKLLSGLEEAVLKNIEACIQLSKITSTSLGPKRNEQDGDQSFGQAVCDE